MKLKDKDDSKAKKGIDHNYSLVQIAQSLDELAKLIGRTDGYSMKIVRDVRNAINNKLDHPLKLWILDEEKYKEKVLGYRSTAVLL